jgi:hypothetical protein
MAVLSPPQSPPKGGRLVLLPLGGVVLPPLVGGWFSPPLVGGWFSPPLGGGWFSPPLGGRLVLPPLGGRLVLPPPWGAVGSPPVGRALVLPPPWWAVGSPPVGGRLVLPPLGGVRGGQLVSGATRPRNLVQHTLNVGLHVAIGKTDHADTVARELLCPCLIVCALVGLIVGMPINLDGQIVRVAKEIEDGTVNRVLAAELDAIEFLATQTPPELALLGRHLAAQFSSALEDGGMDTFCWSWIGHCVFRSPSSPPQSPPRGGRQVLPPLGGVSSNTRFPCSSPASRELRSSPPGGELWFSPLGGS